MGTRDLFLLFRMNSLQENAHHGTPGSTLWFSCFASLLMRRRVQRFHVTAGEPIPTRTYQQEDRNGLCIIVAKIYHAAQATWSLYLYSSLGAAAFTVSSNAVLNPLDSGPTYLTSPSKVTIRQGMHKYSVFLKTAKRGTNEEDMTEN